MTPRVVTRMTGTMMLAAGVVAALTIPASPHQAAPPPTQNQAQRMTVLTAMQRDLGMSGEQAQQRLHRQRVATRTQQRARQALGTRFGGAYFNAETGKLVVVVTDKAAIDDVEAMGARARLGDDSAAELDAIVARLNAHIAAAPSSVTGWYVDSRANSVVVTTAPGTTRQAAGFVRAAKADADAVRVVGSSEQPRTVVDIVGGEGYLINDSALCSIGFAVRDGFVSAGHCGEVGDSTRGPTGTFVGSVFPGSDYSHVQSPATPTAQVTQHDGSTVTVAGHREAPQGASVCRSGATTGWHCGTIEGTNQTVRYPQGPVYELTRTDVCSEPGDSGGPFLAGNQAQGMTSGGSGDCTRGGVTYFQPVNEVLTAYDLELVTS